MRTISSVWSACGPSPQLRTFMEAVVRWCKNGKKKKKKVKCPQVVAITWSVFEHHFCQRTNLEKGCFPDIIYSGVHAGELNRYFNCFTFLMYKSQRQLCETKKLNPHTNPDQCSHHHGWRKGGWCKQAIWRNVAEGELR